MTAPETDDSDDGKSIGAATTTIGSSPAWTFVKAPDADGREPISVRAEWLDDEKGSVGLTTCVAGSEVTISLYPEDARHLAAKIKSAASYAEGDRP
jgi:hypothetical protein